MEFLEQAEFWHWWIAAILFLVLETFAPGAIFLWMGVAAPKGQHHTSMT